MRAHLKNFALTVGGLLTGLILGTVLALAMWWVMDLANVSPVLGNLL